MSQDNVYSALRLTIERLGKNWAQNYKITDERGREISKVNWLNVGGIRVGWGNPDNTVEFSSEMDVEIANEGDEGGRGAGAYIREA